MQLFKHSESADPTEHNKEVIYDYPTSVGSGKDEIAVIRVEMTPNPAYMTVTCSEEHVSSFMIINIRLLYPFPVYRVNT